MFRPGRRLTYVNPYSYLMLRKRKEVFNGFDFIVDSIFMVKMLNLFGITRCVRISADMTGMMPDLFSWAEREGKSVYFVGSTEDAIANAITHIKEGFPELRIGGFRHGFFSDEKEMREFASQLGKANHDVIIAGMGTPMQEEFIRSLDQGWQGVGVTCGGFIHQTAKRLDYYPTILNRLHLRWLFRVWEEPRKVLKRLFFDYTYFILLFGKDFLACSAARIPGKASKNQPQPG
jgi:N-acetylglucosaminyldiphosphoundecaprenol N-acetyl-beta-D-mannosaminyltransferase